MGRLRVMTANLWADYSSPGGLAAVLRGVDPDVLSVCELQSGNAEVIAAHFPHHALEPHPDTMGSGIATRWSADLTRVPMVYRSGWSAHLDPAHWPQLGRALEVVGVHMANPLGWPWWRSARYRTHQLAALLDHIEASDTAQIVVGDFNASPAWPLYRRLADHLTDGAVAAGTAARTWRLRGITPALLRIDHVFGSGVDFLTTSAIDVPGADHRAVVVDVEI